MRLLALAALAVAGAAMALDTSQWPPPAADESRMRELQQIIVSRDSTHEQRDAARAELGRLMMGPGAHGGPAIRNAPPRAAVDPFPSVVKPAAAAPAAPGFVATPDVARLEVVTPPKPAAAPPPASIAAPIGRYTVDPVTGNVYQKTPAGYVDVRTGQLVPR